MARKQLNMAQCEVDMTDQEIEVPQTSPTVQPRQASLLAGSREDDINRHGYTIVKEFHRWARVTPQDRRAFIGAWYDDERPPEVSHPGAITEDEVSGYVVAKNGHVSGTGFEFRHRNHRAIVHPFTIREQAVESACEMIARDQADATRPDPPKIRLATIELAVADAPRRSSGRVNVGLDVDDIQVIDGILDACRHNNTWLPSGQQIDSRADVIRWIVSLVKKKMN